MITENYESIIKKSPKLPLFFCCDHASNLIPKEYNKLGLDTSILKSHIAYDIGAKILTKRLEKRLYINESTSSFPKNFQLSLYLQK